MDTMEEPIWFSIPAHPARRCALRVRSRRDLRQNRTPRTPPTSETRRIHPGTLSHKKTPVVRGDSLFREVT